MNGISEIFQSIINVFLIPFLTLYALQKRSRRKINAWQMVIAYAALVALNLFLSDIVMRLLMGTMNVQEDVDAAYYTIVALISAMLLIPICDTWQHMKNRQNLYIAAMMTLTVGVYIASAQIFNPVSKNEMYREDNDKTKENVADILPKSIMEIKEKPLGVIFTTDVEDQRGNLPYLIEGDLSEFGIKDNCGINYIMDTYEKYGVHGAFFVNIYEHSLYDEDYMPSLLRRISSRGNEVALHAHKPNGNAAMDFYSLQLNEMTVDEQAEVYQYGVDYIEKAIGKRPIAYRAGAYLLNDDTYAALDKVGLEIDSSVFYGHVNNVELEKYSGLKNQCFKVGGGYRVSDHIRLGRKKLD